MPPKEEPFERVGVFPVPLKRGGPVKAPFIPLVLPPAVLPWSSSWRSSSGRRSRAWSRLQFSPELEENEKAKFVSEKQNNRRPIWSRQCLRSPVHSDKIFEGKSTDAIITRANTKTVSKMVNSDERSIRTWLHFDRHFQLFERMLLVDLTLDLQFGGIPD